MVVDSELSVILPAGTDSGSCVWPPRADRQVSAETREPIGVAVGARLVRSISFD